MPLQSPQGGRGGDDIILSWDEWVKKHGNKGGCLVTIKNQDDLCAARAIVVGKARANKDKDPQAYRRLREPDKSQGLRNRPSAQKRAALELMEAAGLKVVAFFLFFIYLLY